jgi:hypothetical protein
MRFCLAMILMLSFKGLFAQRVVDVSNPDHRIGTSSFFIAGGTPFVNDKYVAVVEGTPFFSDEWMGAILVNASNQEFRGVRAKLDLITGEVHYLDANGIRLIATTPIRQVILTDTSGNNYRFIHSSILPPATNKIKEGWYLWLVSGPASLYKYFSKSVSELKPYGSSTAEQTIKTSEVFYVLYGNAYLEIKKIKDAPSVLANKKSEIEEYLKKKENKQTSADDRFTDLITYYNSLFKGQ